VDSIVKKVKELRQREEKTRTRMSTLVLHHAQRNRDGFTDKVLNLSGLNSLFDGTRKLDPTANVIMPRLHCAKQLLRPLSSQNLPFSLFLTLSPASARRLFHGTVELGAFGNE